MLDLSTIRAAAEEETRSILGKLYLVFICICIFGHRYFFGPYGGPGEGGLGPIMVTCSILL